MRSGTTQLTLSADIIFCMFRCWKEIASGVAKLWESCDSSPISIAYELIELV